MLGFAEGYVEGAASIISAKRAAFRTAEYADFYGEAGTLDRRRPSRRATGSDGVCSSAPKPPDTRTTAKSPLELPLRRLIAGFIRFIPGGRSRR